MPSPRRSFAHSLAGLRQDAAFALRSLRRRPAFAATVLLTLALGIAATTSMFTVIDGVLLQPLPYREPGRLVTIYSTFPHWRGQPVVGAQWNTLRTPYPDYRRLIAGQQVFDGVAGFQVSDASLTVANETVSVNEGSATANLLGVLGVSMQAGRWFLPGEDGPGASRVAVLSHELWQSRFGGAPMIGRTVTIDEEPFTVTGILQPGFALGGRIIESNTAQRADLWIPFGVYKSMLQPNNYTLELIGRLRSGVSVARATAATEPLLRGERQAARSGTRIVERADAETGAVKRPLLLLFAAVALLLLITCGNVATLFLSECAVRDSELRTRAVLGAGRGRLARLLLTESAVIALLGGAAGTLLAWWTTRVMLDLAPSELPHAQMIHVNLRVCLFTALVAGVVALLAGVVPAFSFTRNTDGERFSGARIAAGRSRLQTAVIAIQAGMSVILIAGAALLSRSFVNQQHTNPGFRIDRALFMRVDLPGSLDHTNADRVRLYENVGRALGTVAGVLRVSAASMPPLIGRTNGQHVSPKPDEKFGQAGGEAERMVVFPNYFDVMHVPLLAGQLFTEHDVDGTPLVAVVSEEFARRFWPGETAIGKPFRSPNGVATVVGIVGDVKNKALDRAPEAAFYLPAAQSSARLTYLITTRGDPLAVASEVRRIVWATVPGATVSQVATAEELMHRALTPGRYRALIASIFATLALLLTAVGVAGLAARGVAIRLRELCIRMALGATPRRALTLAIGRAVGAIAIGMIGGLLVTPFTSRWLAEYLYQVTVGDLATYGATCAITLAVCVSATIMATKRLRRADLATTLRND
jgi:putative ABC transport system permease protein